MSDDKTRDATKDMEAAPPAAFPSLAEMQQWTRSLGQAQQLLLEHAANRIGKPEAPVAGGWPMMPMLFNPDHLARVQADLAKQSLALWQRFLDGAPADATATPAATRKDRRFADARWSENPFFSMIRQSYSVVADYLLGLSDAMEGVDEHQKEKIRFATQGLIDAMAPSNFPLTNPVVLEKTIETHGENLVRGLRHMLADIEKGQLTQTDGSAFEVGVNIAATPGKVVKETPLYQLIQYTPTTKKVLKTPLIIFPPWINRFYILDLSPEKSFVKWALDQGVSVFMVSWKSADAGMKDVEWADYIVRGQVDAIDTVRALLGVESVHTIGYCVAGTTLAATLAWLAAQGEEAKVASATFFTAQVDFRDAGDLTLFIDDEQLKLVDQLSAPGYLDGRYMAAAFNLLRGRDLIWNYVVNNYLLGADYRPFDLLFWNSDTTNLPAKWHRDYLTDLYRDNKLATPGAITIEGTPIDLRKVMTPCYIQAGKEDHIAPVASVWKLMEQFGGPMKFLLAGSGHIAGVINPPSSGKYQYWTCDKPAHSLDEFIAQAKETPGSWWPDWIAWLRTLSEETVAVRGARIPGKGALPALEEAPGSYVKSH